MENFQKVSVFSAFEFQYRLFFFDEKKVVFLFHYQEI